MDNQDISKYVEYLPRVYHKGSDETYDEFFLGRFLKAFEQILTGSSEQNDIAGIETILDSFEQYLNPSKTPSQFLQWLAGWVGLELEDTVVFYGEIDKIQKDIAPIQILPLDQLRGTINRDMIGSMVQLYQKRGTPQGLLEYLQLFAGKETTISINEFENTARVGEAREIGVNTMVGSASPTFFTVHIVIPIYSRSMLKEKIKLINKIIDNEKPFYTNYKLIVEIPIMRLGKCCRVGKETLLGGMLEK